MYRVDFAHGGYLLCHGAEGAKSGKSLVVRIGECDCHKSTCECVTEVILPKRIVARWGPVAGARGEG